MRKLWILILPAVFAFGLLGCSDDDTTDPTTLTSAEQFTAVHDALIDYINGSAPAVVGASDDLWLDIEAGDYTVLDIRAAADYDNGHIPGAYNTGLGTLMADLGTRAFPTDTKFLVVCYSGQSAGHAVLALRALGYEAYSLKWGMSGWHTDVAGDPPISYDKWTSKCASGVAFETTANPVADTYDWPVWDEGAATEAEAVEARVAAMLTAGFKGKMYSDIVADGLETYFIINYFGEADYMGTGDAGIPGHIEGSYQFTPGASLAMDEMLEYLPTDTDIIVYCWTSQTSSQIAAYLNMLGYSAYSLKFGSNNLWYEDMEAGPKKWNAAAITDRPLHND